MGLWHLYVYGSPIWQKLQCQQSSYKGPFYIAFMLRNKLVAHFVKKLAQRYVQLLQIYCIQQFLLLD